MTYQALGSGERVGKECAQCQRKISARRKSQKVKKNAGLSARLSEPTEVSLVDKGHSDNEKTETEGCSGKKRR